jgi:ubiquinone/menaquinone biosynthesis C-methylase UbiE
LGSNTRIGNLIESICAFDRKDVVLDAGTGGGFLLDRLSSRCGSVFAVDVNSTFLREIGRRITEDNVVLLQADVRKLPFRSSCFDKIICTEVLEHLRDPVSAIEEFYRALKSNGIGVIAVPTRLSGEVYSRLNRDYHRNEMEHVTILEKEQWISLFRKAGFEVLATKNENFQPALYWILRSLFPIKYDPSSGVILEDRLSDRVFWFVMRASDRVTFGGFDRFGNKIFPKSWYFYLRKTCKT